MVDYETFCRIRDHLVRQQLTAAQTARALGLDTRTVARWANVEQFRARKAVPRASKLDAFKGQIVRWLDAHPYSAQQIYQRLAEAGYAGGITIVKDYVHRIRPRRQPAFLKLDFEPGECAQIDWGEFGTVTVGNTRRRLSFFVMVLCYSRPNLRKLVPGVHRVAGDGVLFGLPRERLRRLRLGACAVDGR